MATLTRCLTRTIPSFSSLVSRSAPSLSISSANFPTLSLQRLRPLSAATVSVLHRLGQSTAARRSFATRQTSSSPNSNWSNRPPKETILLDGCDFEHWLVVMKQPEGDPTREEIIDSYVKTLAMIVGSEEEARKKIYSVSTRCYWAFGALVSEEVSQRIKELPRVSWVLPDSYLDVRNKDYGGEPFIDGQAVPYDPKYHEEWNRNYGRASRNSKNTRPRNSDRPRRRENMQSGDFQSRGMPPMQNSAPNPGAGQPPSMGAVPEPSTMPPPPSMGGVPPPPSMSGRVPPPSSMGGGLTSNNLRRPQNFQGESPYNYPGGMQPNNYRGGGGEGMQPNNYGGGGGGMQPNNYRGGGGGMPPNNYGGGGGGGGGEGMQPNNYGGGGGGMQPNNYGGGGGGMPPNNYGGGGGGGMPLNNYGGGGGGGMPAGSYGGGGAAWGPSTVQPNYGGGGAPNNYRGGGGMPQNNYGGGNASQPWRDAGAEPWRNGQ